MSLIKVDCEIKDYSEPKKETIKVHSHWNINRFVDIEINGEIYTVNGKELKTAIDNCMNTGF